MATKSQNAPAPGATRWVLIAVAGLVAAILGLSLSMLAFGPGPDRAQKLGGPFTLIDQNGREVTEAILKNRISLVYFGFTYCPDFCPTELYNMVAARAELRKLGVDPQLVFISIDPDRDRPKTMGDYVEVFGDDIIGLTGSPQQVAAAAKQYQAIYQKVPLGEDEATEPGDYTMSHSTQLYAVGRDAKVFHRFPAATPPDVIAQRVLKP